jgi:uncharacterized protein (TIGR02117 family)
MTMVTNETAWRQAGRVLARLVGAVVALLLAFLIAALIGGAIPVHSAYRAPAKGVRIWVVDNGVHTDLVLPVAEAGVDWSQLIGPDAFPDRRAHTHLSFGWGDRDFYLNTPSWSDARPGRIVRALLGGGATVMHVERMLAPEPGPDVRVVMLRPEAYRRLAAFVAATFAPGGAPVRAYGPNDAFYPALRRYSAVHSCNDWTGRALREAGVRMGAWTPMAFQVTAWLSPAGPEPKAQLGSEAR